MDKITHEMRLMQWAPIIRECRNSEMSVKAWCQLNNVHEKQFHYWQRRIREEAYDALAKPQPQNHANFVQLPIPSKSQTKSPAFEADMLIRIGNAILEISNSTSEELLSKVMKVLSNVE